MSAIDQVFQRLRSEGRKAFVPFVTAGDPNLEFTEKVVQTLADCGCHLCEIGIPYSDPIADGPVIQSSYTRVLSQGTRLKDIFAMIENLSAKVQIPLITMVSYSIVFRRGLEEYVNWAKRAGVAGLIVPDLPVEESNQLAELCRREDLSLIQLVTPTTPPERAKRIAESASGFIYYVSVTGITGEREQLPKQIIDSVSNLKKQTHLPICIGFGISRPEHVRMLAPVCDGLIVGSAIVRRIAQLGAKTQSEVLEDIRQFVGTLLRELEHAASRL